MRTRRWERSSEAWPPSAWWPHWCRRSRRPASAADAPATVTVVHGIPSVGNVDVCAGDAPRC